MKQENKNSFRKEYYLIYSGVFLFCVFCFYFYLFINGKTSVNFVSDGMNQHYRVLLYYSRYLKNIFLNHEIPLWDFSIGEGADIIKTFHSDAIGDPLTFLSVLVPERFIPQYYVFNTIVRIYLAGVFFSEFCFYTGKKDLYAVLAGTLTYIFCFWSLQSITLHIYFLTPLMYLPLLILGAEMIIQNDKPFVFIVAVFLSSISWLYFFYMEALATAIYGVSRLVYVYKKDFKLILKKLIQFAVFAIWGVLMAAEVLCPMVFAYMGDSRMGIKTSVPLLYSRFFYERLFTVFVSNDSPYDMCMGFASATLLSIALLLKNYKKNLYLLFLNMVCLISVCIPMLGKVWNGFAYVSERWSFVIAMPIAYTLVSTWKQYKENKKYLGFSFIVIIFLSVFSAWSRTERVFVPVILCVVFYLIATSNINKEIFKKDLRQVLMIGLIVFNILYIFEYNLSPRGGDVIDDLLSIEELNGLTSTSEAYTMKKLMDGEEFSRYTGNYLTNNATITFGSNSTNFYFSITNPDDQRFRLLMNLRDRISWQLLGYDERAELETLANVKYYVAQDWYTGYLPYGFEYDQTVDGYKIYKNKYALPFGYTYKDSISYEDWYELNSVEKQEAMIKAVVLDKEDSSKIELNTIKVPCEVLETENIDIENDSFIVKEKNATLRLKVTGSKGFTDHYLTIDGLDYSDTFDVVENDQTEARIEIKTPDGVSSYIYHETPEHRYFYGKDDYVVYLGYRTEALDEVVLSFNLPGTYRFNEIYVSSHSMDEYEKDVMMLSEDHLEDLVFTANTIEGTIDVDEEKYLLLSIPYSKGWTAFVDDKEVEILKANEHYIALRLDKGSHQIQLKYKTQGLVPGIAVSTITILGFILYVCLERKKDRKSA